MFQTIVSDPFARGIIRRKVRQLIDCSGFHEQDAEDLEQELLYRLLRSLRTFVESHPQHRNTFITAVVERSATTLHRQNRTRKKYCGTIRSLHATRSAGGDDTSERSGEATDPSSRRSFDQAELSLDLSAILAELPADLRDLADRLQQKPFAAVARELNVPASTLQRRRTRLREVLSEAHSNYFS